MGVLWGRSTPRHTPAIVVQWLLIITATRGWKWLILHSEKSKREPEIWVEHRRKRENSVNSSDRIEYIIECVADRLLPRHIVNRSSGICTSIKTQIQQTMPQTNHTEGCSSPQEDGTGKKKARRVLANIPSFLQLLSLTMLKLVWRESLNNVPPQVRYRSDSA